MKDAKVTPMWYPGSQFAQSLLPDILLKMSMGHIHGRFSQDKADVKVGCILDRLQLNST